MELRQALHSGLRPETLLQQARAQLLSRSAIDWLIGAQGWIAAGFPREASVLLEEAGRRWPESLVLRYWLGNALRLAKEAQAAEAVLRSVLQAQPGHEHAALSLAYMLRDQGRLSAACDAILALLRHQGGGVEHTLRAGKFFEECRRYAMAADVYEAEIARGSTHPRLMFAAGDASMVLGRFDIARQHLEAALRNGLNIHEWSGVWQLLANLQRYTSRDHPDIDRFNAILNDAGQSAATRASAAFALGKALGDVGDFAGAVRALRQANALERSRRAWSDSAWTQFVDGQIRSRYPQVWTSPPKDEAVPVFIVGLPRTGTTLVAELIGRHAGVKGRGELNWIPFLHQQLEGSRQLDDPASLRRAAGIYMEHVRQDDSPARWYIDKNPLNFRHLGMIAAMFPWARVIHCHRDRRDTALSIWSLHFAHEDIAFAYDFESIAAFARGHDRLMRHWRETLDLPIFSVIYEELVTRPDKVMADLADFIGLPAEEPANTGSKSGAAIATASVWQARQPIYANSVGRWRNYAPYLPELVERFAE
jgi:tetratricopeptide (TPR) repeat protein